MKNRSKTLIAASLLTVGALAAVPAFSHGNDHERGHGRGPGIERMAERLDLTEQQQMQVRTIRDQSREAMRGYRDSLHDNRQKLRELVRSGNADEAGIRELADAQGAIVADMVFERARTMQAVRAVLTPEQQAQADTFMEQHREERHEDRHERRGKGDWF